MFSSLPSNNWEEFKSQPLWCPNLRKLWGPIFYPPDIPMTLQAFGSACLIMTTGLGNKSRTTDLCSQSFYPPENQKKLQRHHKQGRARFVHREKGENPPTRGANNRNGTCAFPFPTKAEGRELKTGCVSDSGGMVVVEGGDRGSKTWWIKNSSGHKPHLIHSCNRSSWHTVGMQWMFGKFNWNEKKQIDQCSL